MLIAKILRNQMAKATFLPSLIDEKEHVDDPDPRGMDRPGRPAAKATGLTCFWRLDAKPFELSRQFVPRVIGLQHAPMQMMPRRRGMQNRRRIEPDIAAIREASGDTASRNCCLDPILGDPAQPVRSGRHKERRIVLGHIVDVNPNRHHAFDQAEWRLDMLKPPLRRPRAEVRCVDPLTDRSNPDQRLAGQFGNGVEEIGDELRNRSRRPGRSGRLRPC
jgi:hypothetical protein